MHRRLSWLAIASMSCAACSANDAPQSPSADPASDAGSTVDDATTRDARVSGDVTDVAADATESRDAAAIDFTPGKVPADAPAWIAPLVPGTWTAISKNTIAELDPALDPKLNPKYPDQAPWYGSTGLAAVMTAWCGGAFAYGFGTKGSLLIWGGGHADYHGNEMYAFDLETLRWSRLSNPYATPVFKDIDAYPEGHYPDGTPVPPHTTDRVDYHPGTNSFVTLEVERNSFGGYLLPIPYMFSLDKREWRRGPKSPKDLAYMGWSAYDSKRDLFWVEGGGISGTPLSSFDPKTKNADGSYGTWTNYAPQIGALGTIGAYDPIHDIVVVTSFRDAPEIFGIEAAKPAVAAVKLAYDGAIPAALKQAHGWEWSAKRSSFIYWAGAHVYEFKATGDWRTTRWTWVDLTNPANAVTPDYIENGVFSRFRIAAYGGLEVAVTVNSISKQVYAFRLP